MTLTSTVSGGQCEKWKSEVDGCGVGDGTSASCQVKQ